jgi:hypothetical protein
VTFVSSGNSGLSMFLTLVFASSNLYCSNGSNDQNRAISLNCYMRGQFEVLLIV